MNDTVIGQPITMRVTGLHDPAAFTASSPDTTPVETEVRGSDLLVHLPLGGHSLLVAPH
jgi:hypothetical protein